MAIVGWIAVVAGALAAVGLSVLANIVWRGARDGSDRRFAAGLSAGALVAIALPALGVYLGSLWLSIGSLVLGIAVVVVLPAVLSAAAQP